MTFRIEQKLFIKKDALIDFKIYLKKKKDVQKLYQPRIVESLYFDNSNYQMYNDSIEGVTPRKKIRIRNYPEEIEKIYFKELKISSVEGRFKKRKIIEDREFENNIQNGIFDHQYGLCKPKIFVKYNREYFKLNDLRITIDENIEYQSYLKKFIFKDQQIIVEIKTSIEKSLDELTSIFPFQKIRFSKEIMLISSAVK